MAGTKITKRVVDAALEDKRARYVWDGELPGFGIRVRASGAATYVLDYRTEGGRRGQKRRYTIGPVGTLTPDEARKLAQGIIGSVRKGADPAAERAVRRKATTVAELCDLYLKAAEEPVNTLGKKNRSKKASTLATDRGRIERHIKPLLGQRSVRDLLPTDMTRFLRDVAAGKTAAVTKTEKLRGKAVVTGGAGTAARTLGLLGGILTFAVAEGIIPQNPAIGVKRPAYKKRERFLSPEEYGALGAALKAAEAEGETPQAVQAVWLLALTGCRRGEIERLRWSEVHQAAGCLRLADSKEGASIRPIGRAAFDLLDGIARIGDCPFVLPAVRGKGAFAGLPGAWDRIMRRAGLEGVTPHTLRHSFASVAAGEGLELSLATVAALLGHAAGGVTAGYIHHVDEALRRAADRVAQAVHTRMVGGAMVLQMPMRASKG